MKLSGRIGVNKEQLIALLGSKMYCSRMQDVAIKELVQNAFDSVKLAKATGQLLHGRVTVDLTYDRKVTVTDNGVGMSPDVVQKAFFTIGGSDKGNIDPRLRSGGLGLAKIAFLFGGKFTSLTTVHNGVMTQVDATCEELMRDDFSLKVSEVDKPNGTTVEVVIPEYYYDNNGEKCGIPYTTDPRYTFLDKPLIGDIDLVVNGKSSYKGVIPEGYISLGKAKASFGEIEILIKETSSPYSYIDVNYLMSGLFQFTKSVYVQDKAHVRVIANILPTVGVTDSQYPMNNSREGFRGTVRTQIEDLEYLLKRIDKAVKMGVYAQAFKSTLSMNVRKLETTVEPPKDSHCVEKAVQTVLEELSDVVGEPLGTGIPISLETVHEYRRELERHLDTSGIKIPDSVTVDTTGMSYDKPVFHNATNMVVDTRGQQIVEEFGALLLEFKELYKTVWGDSCRLVNFSQQYWGVSFDSKYLGVNCKFGKFKFIGINPFSVNFPNNPIVDNVQYGVEFITHLIMHEITHNWVGGHYDDFAGRLAEIHANTYAMGKSFRKWQEKLYLLIADNLQLFQEYHEKYKISRNIGISLNSED